MSLRLLLLLAALLGSASIASAQTGASANAVFLVASPALLDPNFRRSVVLVTQVAGGGSVGFIVNRPGTRSLAQILPENEVMQRYTEPLYLGGPVEAAGLFAIFRASENPPGALRVLSDVSFALDPAVVEQLLHTPPRRVRFFNGYAGWAPGQLALELDRGGWYLLNADANTVFRDNMDTLWEELLVRARAVTAFARQQKGAPTVVTPGPFRRRSLVHALSIPCQRPLVQTIHKRESGRDHPSIPGFDVVLNAAVSGFLNYSDCDVSFESCLRDLSYAAASRREPDNGRIGVEKEFGRHLPGVCLE